MSALVPIEIRARGRKVSGWSSLKIEADLEEAARAFSVQLSGYYAATGQSQLVIGDAVEVFDGADRLLTGYVEAATDHIDATTETVSLAGRSKTGDAIDCSARLGAWSRLKLSALFDRIRGDHDVDLVDETDVSETIIRSHRTEPGESIFDALERHVRELGALVTDDAQGRLVLTRAGLAGRATSPIVQGAGVIASDGGWSHAARFGSYDVRGQVVGDADIEADGSGFVADAGVTRHRRLVVVPDKPTSKAGALRRARWEAASRAGKSLSVTYTVRGWRHKVDTGAHWAPNQLVEVVDGRRGIFGETLLVTRVALTADAGGRRAEVTVQPVQGVELLAAGQALAPGPGRWVSLEAAEEFGRRTR
ncbi:MAG: hypothetical protein IT385_08195 [Deltaproteobacteria bacterium]|nr:hypothetical protein [Deltaproteobacteria bacterium]